MRRKEREQEAAAIYITTSASMLGKAGQDLQIGAMAGML